MEKKSIFKRIKDYFQKQKTGQKLALSIVKGTRKGMGIPEYDVSSQEVSEVYHTTEVEPNFVVYSEEERELKYVAIDKLFELQERFSKKEYLWIKQMVVDPRFLRAYFESTNAALIEYLVLLNNEGRFSYNILEAMESLGMVVLSIGDRAKFIDLDEYFGKFSFDIQPLLHDEMEHKIETSSKKNS